MSIPSKLYTLTIWVIDLIAFVTQESIDVGLKCTSCPCMVSPPRLRATLTFEWLALVEETLEGVRFFVSQ